MKKGFQLQEVEAKHAKSCDIDLASGILYNPPTKNPLKACTLRELMYYCYEGSLGS